MRAAKNEMPRMPSRPNSSPYPMTIRPGTNTLATVSPPGPAHALALSDIDLSTGGQDKQGDQAWSSSITIHPAPQLLQPVHDRHPFDHQDRAPFPDYPPRFYNAPRRSYRGRRDTACPTQGMLQPPAARRWTWNERAACGSRILGAAAKENPAARRNSGPHAVERSSVRR